jgi:hypothetical protein
MLKPNKIVFFSYCENQFENQYYHESLFAFDCKGFMPACIFFPTEKTLVLLGMS